MNPAGWSAVPHPARVLSAAIATYIPAATTALSAVAPYWLNCRRASCERADWPSALLTAATQISVAPQPLRNANAPLAAPTAAAICVLV